MDSNICWLGILTLIVASLFTPVCAEGNPPAIDWEYTYGVREGSFQRVIPSGEGFLVLGDHYRVQLDRHGNKIGEHIIPTGESGYAFHLDTTPDGGFILYGDMPDESSSRAPVTDIVLLRMDTEGTRLWKKIINGSFEKGVAMVKVTEDGGFILTGHNERRPWDSDIYIAKTDSNGNVQWDHTIGGDRMDLGIDVALSTDGGYVILGEYCPLTYVSSEPIPQVPGGPTTYALYLVKLDPGGTIEWSNFYSEGSGNLGGASVVQADDGGFIIAGHADSLDRYTLHDPSHCDLDFYILRTGPAGEVIWERRYPACDIPEYRGDVASDLVLTKDGGMLMAGDTPVPGFGYNATAVKADSSGMIEWRATYTGFTVESVFQNDDGSYVITGSKAVNDKFHPWVMKLSAETTPVPETSPPVVSTTGAPPLSPSPSLVAATKTAAVPLTMSQVATDMPVQEQLPLLSLTVCVACAIVFLMKRGP